jgi:hypothetical protein
MGSRTALEELVRPPPGLLSPMRMIDVYHKLTRNFAMYVSLCRWWWGLLHGLVRLVPQSQHTPTRMF